MPRDGILGSFEQMVLLAILQVGESAYAPLVLEKLQEGLGRKVSRGSVYVTLDRLERKGLLRSTAGRPEKERGGRPKRYLAVTDTGIAELKKTRASLLTFWAGLDEVLEK
jgi:DNA-binding PadR family transcriptional regulator